MNGVEAARIMKEFWQEIAIIGISSAPDPHITDAFLKAGAAAVVSKDQGDHLYSTIRNIFRSQSARLC
jgi:DNA-binding NarL/FixJ family response regulator